MLNADGTVPAGGTADKSLVTDGFVSVTLSSQVEDGAEIIQKNSSGALCVNEKQPSSFKRFTVEIMFCGVNPYLLTMISSGKVYLDVNGSVVGFTQAEGEITSKFALEMWTGVSGTRTASGYFLLPLVNGGVLSDIKVEGTAAIDFTIKDAYTQGGNSWGTGPYDVAEGAGTNEVQTVTVSGTPTGGSFELTFAGDTTTPVMYNAVASDLQSALDALGSIGHGNALVGGGPFPGTPMTVTFRNALGSQDVPAMTVSANTLTGGTTPNAAVATTTPGVAGVASELPTGLDALDHLLIMVSDVAVPAADCSPVAIPM